MITEKRCVVLALVAAALSGGMVVCQGCVGSEPQVAGASEAGATDGSLADGPAAPDGSASDASDAATTDSGDGATTCDPAKRFNAPTQLSGFDTLANEGSPYLSPDELTIYFSGSGGSLSDAAAGERLFTASRATTTDSFGPPKQISATATSSHPSVSTNGLTLVYANVGLVPYKIWFATRGSTLADFSNPSALAGISSAQDDVDPFVAADGTELWFASDRTGGQGSSDIYSAGNIGSAFANPLAAATLNSSGYDGAPVLSADRLTIFILSDRPGTSGGYDIWVAHRSSPSATFPVPATVPELNSAQNDYPGWLSADNCRMYMASDRSGRSQIYVATRAP